MRKSVPRFLFANVLLLSAVSPWLQGAEITVALVTVEVGKSVSVEERQALWKSPFGGWVVSAWPFGLKVDDTPVFEYQTASEKLLDNSITQVGEADDEEFEKELEGLAQNDKVRPEDLKTFRFKRRAEVTLTLGQGRHVVHPFGLVFNLAADGTLTTKDPRLRVDTKAGRVEVLCHPVTVKTLVENRSVARPLGVSCGGTALLGGLESIIAEFARKNEISAGVSEEDGYLRLTLYLPASAPQQSYKVNGVRFELDAGGKIKLLDTASARSPKGREVHLVQPEYKVVPTQRLGIGWIGPAGAMDTASSTESVNEVGSNWWTWKTIPTGRPLPERDSKWPHMLLLRDMQGTGCWSIETPLLTAKPGDSWSCRVTALKRERSDLPRELSVTMTRSSAVATSSLLVGSERHAGSMSLRGEGIYALNLPKAPGLWQVTASDNTPFAGQPLALVHIAERAPAVAVSLFTYRNRAVCQRGDVLSVLWHAKLSEGHPALELPIFLKGKGLEAVVGKIAIPQDEKLGAASGCLKLDTTALAPGEYVVEVQSRLGTGEPREDGGIICYPYRFRVAQLEPRSDYEIYSHVFGQALPYAGSPVNAYYLGIPDGPGLSPLLNDNDASLDSAFASYTDAPFGPSLEKFARPTAEERRLMALAALGMRAVPTYPSLLHHEDWNPKHTLPEDLKRMRRRLALYTQPMADVPGLGGITLGWYASAGGAWEEVSCQDGHQAKRNAAAGKWVAARVEEAMKKPEAAGLEGAQQTRARSAAAIRASSSVLPNAWAEYLADVEQMAPGLTSHNSIPSWWLGGGGSYAPYAYSTLTHRNAVDYSDYGLTAWGNFRTPAWMNMGNRQRQKLLCNFMANQLFNRIVTSFCATGRGLDGISMPVGGDYPQGEDEALLRIFERFGSYFSALDPLPDVALYNTDTYPQNVAMHDLARMRRPAMLLGQEDVLAGELEEYRVLFLVSARDGEPDAVLEAFKKFEARGGIIVKDRTSHASLPGRDLGFGYEGKQVHPVWGLAYANSEDEFAHLWINFKETREKFLTQIFADIPGLPVTTSDVNAVISPLAGKESICCFVANQTLVPTSLQGRWRQYFVLPKNGELQVEKGWHVHNLLAGRPAAIESTPQGQRAVVDFTRAEGAVYLLTRREPKSMSMRAERPAPHKLSVTAWLADEGEKPISDPMPFEVTLRGPDGETLFHKFAALSSDLSLEVPVPARSGEAKLELSVRDLVIGSAAKQSIDPAPATVVSAKSVPDLIGGDQAIHTFLTQRKARVTVLLDEGQESFRPAAEQLAALLKKNGREARVVMWEPADVRPLPLRWKPIPEDMRLIGELAGGNDFAWRVALGAVSEKTKDGGPGPIQFDDPACGYNEYGPRLRHDADIVLFGAPKAPWARRLPAGSEFSPWHRALADLEPYLRRVPSFTYPAPGGFFIHYLWSPFRGGFDGLYLGCRDASGAEAAVASLAALSPSPKTPAPNADAQPVVTRGGSPTPLEDMIVGKFGRRILNLAFAPNGKRLFVMQASFGEQLFALSSDGEVLQSRKVHHRTGNFYQRPSGLLQALDEQTVRIGVGDGQYRFSFEKGFVSRAVPPSTGFFGNKSVPVAASTLMEDEGRFRVYFGGKRYLYALDKQGRRIWTYDDSRVRTGTSDLLYPRSLFPRAVSGDGRVLLVAGFGIQEMAFQSHPVNASVIGLDTATGKLLWQASILLNEGKVFAMDDRFLIVDDSGETRVFMAADGKETGRLRPVEGAAWMLPVPGRNEMMIVENGHFDRSGLAARVYLRPVGGEQDRKLQVQGRITGAVAANGGQSVLVSTDRGQTVCFATADLKPRWSAKTPSGGLLRISPDGKAVWVGARDGVLHKLDAATGESLRRVDLNPYSVTTPERFVQEMEPMGEVPAEAALKPPAAPPGPSYRTTLGKEKAPLGPNLIDANRLKSQSRPAQPAAGDPAGTVPVGILAPGASFTLEVEAGRTYLVELLAAAADSSKLTPQTRLEVAVTGARQTANLPYLARLPLTRFLGRRRCAFRADEAGKVTLTLRAVEPQVTGQGNQSARSYAKVVTSDAGLLGGELMVASIGFKGANLLLEGGPTAKRSPLGTLACQVNPWTGGSTLVRTSPYHCPQAALRCVDGKITNQETAWTTGARGAGINLATGHVKFKKPQTLTSIAIYEDNTGPVVAGHGVREKTAMRYCVYVRRADTREMLHLGSVVDNTNLINIFECPEIEVDEILYYWAGRTDSPRTDGPVRMAEIEAYADDISMIEDLDGGADVELLDLD